MKSLNAILEYSIAMELVDYVGRELILHLVAAASV